jgi:hypothetical protein
MDTEICEDCNCVINCINENIYIITKGDEERLWCMSCFEDMWKDAANEGWGGDDIECYLEEEQKKQIKKEKRREKKNAKK